VIQSQTIKNIKSTFSSLVQQGEITTFNDERTDE